MASKNAMVRNCNYLHPFVCHDPPHNPPDSHALSESDVTGHFPFSASAVIANKPYFLLLALM